MIIYFSNEIVLQTEIELLGFTPEIKSFTHVNLSTESIIIMNIYPKWKAFIGVIHYLASFGEIWIQPSWYEILQMWNSLALEKNKVLIKEIRTKWITTALPVNHLQFTNEIILYNAYFLHAANFYKFYKSLIKN